jgi:hypothetical protein
MAKEPQNTPSPAADPRANASAERGADDARASRDTQSRVWKDMTNAERLELFRAHMNDSILPMPKAPEGWHYIYLSTTNQYDTIQNRKRFGYIEVRPEEVPGFDFEENTITGGAYTGCVGIKEMVLFKIEDELYQGMMKILHHEMPNAEAQKLLNLTRSPSLSEAGIEGEVDVRRDVGDGERALQNELIRKRAAPRRFG